MFIVKYLETREQNLKNFRIGEHLSMKERKTVDKGTNVGSSLKNQRNALKKTFH